MTSAEIKSQIEHNTMILAHYKSGWQPGHLAHLGEKELMLMQVVASLQVAHETALLREQLEKSQIIVLPTGLNNGRMFKVED